MGVKLRDILDALMDVTTQISLHAPLSSSGQDKPIMYPGGLSVCEDAHDLLLGLGLAEENGDGISLRWELLDQVPDIDVMLNDDHSPGRC